MDPKIKKKDLERLYEAVLSLKTTKECDKFFEDICTISELAAITQRLKVAFMLSEKQTCHDIAEKTGASTATISRVNRCLNYGPGGYNMVIERYNASKQEE